MRSNKEPYNIKKLVTVRLSKPNSCLKIHGLVKIKHSIFGQIFPSCVALAKTFKWVVLQITIFRTRFELGLVQGQVRETEKTTKNSRFPWSQCSNLLFELFRNKYITRKISKLFVVMPFPTRISFLFWCHGFFSEILFS